MNLRRVNVVAAECFAARGYVEVLTRMIGPHCSGSVAPYASLRGIVAFDTSSLSRSLGTEVSGILGYNVLSLIRVRIDYRDGLVDFTYDPKRLGMQTSR